MTSENKEKQKHKVSKEEAKKLNKELEETRASKEDIENAKKTMGEAVEQLKHPKEIIQEEKEEILKKLKNPDLLLNIKKTLDQDHIGDDKGKLFLFCTCLSSRLRPSYRFSAALTGYTSEGKTNLWQTIKEHLPDEWYMDLTRVTGSSLEDDIHDFNLLYFGEKNANKQITEQVKQIVEDGMSVLKKDVRKDYKTARWEKQPRKVGIYSTTKNIEDEELSSRYCVISVHGNPKKYRIVNKAALSLASNAKKQIEKIKRKKKQTWIEKCLRFLEPYDIIEIPYAELFNIESRKGRSQRDLKRFLNLIRVLTWLHQYKRYSYEYDDFKILVSTPEDFYNAMEIGKEIFDQSLSGVEPRLQKVIDSYKKLKKESTEILEDAENLEWVDRSLLQKDLGIAKRDTIRRHIKELADMNIFTYFNKGNRSYVAFKFNDSPTNLPTNNPLITDRQTDLYNLIKTNYRPILKQQLVGDWSLVPSLEKFETSCLSLKTDLPTNFTEKPLISRLKKEISAKKPKIGRSNRSVDKKTSQYQRFKHVFGKIKDNKKAGFKITKDFLYNNFKKETVDHLIKTNTLVKQGNGEYVLS